jgi:predicted DNA-binding transcriptional regulator YafY
LEGHPEHIIINEDGSLSLKDTSFFRRFVLNKLASNALFKDGAEEIQKAVAGGKKVLILSGSFLSYEKVLPTLNTLLEYLQKQIIEIDYKKKTFTVKPYLIVLEHGFWYLSAFSLEKGRFIDFRLDNIKNVRPSAPFEASDEERLLSGKRYFAEKNGAVITILIDADAAEFFKNRKIFISQKIEEEKRGGALKLTFAAADEDDFILQAAPWACFIKVLSPKRYRSLFADYLKEAVRKNS